MIALRLRKRRWFGPRNEYRCTILRLPPSCLEQLLRVVQHLHFDPLVVRRETSLCLIFVNVFQILVQVENGLRCIPEDSTGRVLLEGHNIGARIPQ